MTRLRSGGGQRRQERPLSSAERKPPSALPPTTHDVPGAGLRCALQLTAPQGAARRVGARRSAVAVMIAGTIHEQQDELPGENLEAFRIGRRHNQIDAGSTLRADAFAKELAGDLRPRSIGSPARSRAVHKARAPSSANMMRKLQPRLAAIRRARLTAFGKSFWSRDVALG